MQSQPPPPSDKDNVVTHTHPPTAVIAETANRFVCPGVVVATVAVIEVTQAFAHFSGQAAVAVSTALVVVAAIGILEYQVSATLHSGRDLWRATCRVCLLEHASH